MELMVAHLCLSLFIRIGNFFISELEIIMGNYQHLNNVFASISL